MFFILLLLLVVVMVCMCVGVCVCVLHGTVEDFRGGERIDISVSTVQVYRGKER